MAHLHPKKIRRLLKHFKRIKEGGVDEKTKYSEVKTEIKKEKPKLKFGLEDDIKLFKESMPPIMPKIVVETKAKQAIKKLNKDLEEAEQSLNQRLEKTTQLLNKRFGDTEEDLNQDERRLYDLFSELSDIKENLKEHEEDIKEQESENDEQAKKIADLEREIEFLENKRPVTIKNIEQVTKLEFPDTKPQKPTIAQDVRVDTLQNSLLVMQNKLNQLIQLKVNEENDKMKENQERLNAIDKAIKKFEMKLIRLQGKHSQKKLKPLIKKINDLKEKYNQMAVKVKSREGIELGPIEIGKIPDLPQQPSKLKGDKQVIQKYNRIPSSLDLPDITSEGVDLRVDLPEPIPSMDVEIKESKKTQKHEGFLDYIGKEVKKFLHI